MNKNRITYLFGAGAVMDWQGPSTPSLTKLICENGFKCKGDNKYVTQFIFEKLTKYLPKNEVNFETILNVIEELMVFHAAKDYQHPNSILFPFLLEREDLDMIFNFTLAGEWDRNKNLTIPGMGSQAYGTALQGQSPKQFYLESLYKELLTEINGKVSSYAYHTPGHSKINTKENNQLNNDFINWVKSHNNSIHRLYTLNYDRLFSVLLKNSNVNTFEGADFSSELDYVETHDFDIKKISSEFDINCYYNLHGSSFWKVTPRNKFLLASIKFSITGTPNSPINDYEVPLIEMEKGKKIVVSNIISGYQKTQKLSLTPFRQMQAAFDRDCLFSDKIYIVGYSFGDKHINEILRQTITANPKVKIVIIDPAYKNEKQDNASLEVWSDSNYQPIVINEKFADYLKKQT